MGAVVHVDFRAERAKRIALNRAETVRQLAEDLLATHGFDGVDDDEARATMGAYWLQQGFCNEADLKLAFEAIGEMG